MTAHIIDKRGNIIFSAEVCGFFEGGLCPVQVGGKWGYINQNGKIIIPCQFDDAYSFYGSVALVKKDNKWGVINSKGKLICPCYRSEPNSVPPIHDGIICRVGEDPKERCYIDIDGNIVIDTSNYSYIGDFCNGYASVQRNDNEYGLINTKGEIVIPFGKYNYIWDVYCGVAEVEVRNSTGDYKSYYGYVDTSGKEVVPIGKYDRIDWREQYNCIVRVIKGDKFGYVDKRNGKEITPIAFDYSKIDKFSMYNSEDMTVIKTDTKVYIYNEESHVVNITTSFSDIGFFSEGLCAVIADGKVGFINKEGKEVIPCKFDEQFGAYGIKFEGGLCNLKDKLINMDGDIVKEFPGYYASYVGSERYVLTYTKGWVHSVMIDKYGKTLFKGEGGSLIETLSTEFPIAVRENLWGFMDENGKLVIPYQFQQQYMFHNGFATIEEPVSNSVHRSSGNSSSSSSGGCYIATAVYGSYDCPEVWTLRRYRDDVLDNSWYGRLFIRAYYAISPRLVKWFGTAKWFRNLFYNPLNRWVRKLNERGFKNTPYKDKY